jgi:hypothetical protein
MNNTRPVGGRFRRLPRARCQSGAGEGRRRREPYQRIVKREVPRQKSTIAKIAVLEA